MKIIVLHVEDSADTKSFYGELADIFSALAEQHYGSGYAAKFLENLADLCRSIEGTYQRHQFLRQLRRIK